MSGYGYCLGLGLVFGYTNFRRAHYHDLYALIVLKVMHSTATYGLSFNLV